MPRTKKPSRLDEHSGFPIPLKGNRTLLLISFLLVVGWLAFLAYIAFFR